MKSIVAVDMNWGIGKDNQLLFHIKKDMEFFKETTMGKRLLLGRKTLESFPDGKPLPGRMHYVLTSQDLTSEYDNVKYIHDITEVPNIEADDIFLIGGGSMYEQYIDYCSEAYVTLVMTEREADTYFPVLMMPQWDMTTIVNSGMQNGITFFIYKYVNQKIKEVVYEEK